ncbi:MAG: hypothetical protein H6670_20445 [Anaerolineaceae bacterium]|nr:hypothetical protein [Anaerolineaceae bacterium]
MVSEVITILAPIQAGQEDACRAVVSTINEPDGVTIDFARMNLTHFARFVVLQDVDSGKNRKRLLFTAVHDGDRDTYLRDLRDSTSDVDAIWGCCEGYTGASSFVQFMNGHNIKTNLFLKAYRYETVGNIQKYLALRQELSDQFDVPLSQYSEAMRQLPRQFAPISWLRRGLRAISTFIKFVLITIGVIPQIIGLLRHGLALIPATIISLTQVKLDREYSDASLDKSGPCVPFAPGDEVGPCMRVDTLPAFQQRKQVQNQVTIVTVNGPKTTRRQHAVIDSFGAFIKIPFITRNRVIPTIHFARWVMIDGGRRMLFISDYDGTASAYFADFVNRLPSGLNTLWDGSIGWRYGATLDPEAFTEGILCHNTPASFHYSAYPHTTVVGIEQARRLYYAYHDNINEKSAAKWLKYL